MGQRMELTVEPEMAMSFREADSIDRIDLYREPFRPQYHFTEKNGWNNDPNGLVKIGDTYHMFYQQYPPVFPRQHWGHAVSDDMVHWEDLPSAIYPDIENACFSGNTLVEDDRVIAMYHGWGIGNMIATSNDPLLLNWEKNPNNPVIPHLPNLPESGLPYRVFDPFIWKEEDGYYSLSGTHSNGIMKEHLFFSQNLDKWTYLGQLMDNNPHVECSNDGACPYFLPFGQDENQRILFFFSHSSGSRALIGKYDKITHKFVPKKNIKFSFDSVCVSSLVAPCAISDGKGGVYVIYNMGDSVVGRARRGVFSLMRHITTDAEDNIWIKPAEQNESLRANKILDEGFELAAFEKKELTARGKCIEINAEISMNEARSVEFRVLCDKEGKEYTTISIISGMNRVTPCGYITVDTSHASLYNDVIGRIPDSTRFLWDGKEKVNVRIFVDKCMVEVFVNDRAALCQMAYASLPESDGITVEALGGNATVENIKIFEMDSIY
jgi:beta-fructofuranosidase